MKDKVWVGKKVQVLSLEELERNHFKDRVGSFWFSEQNYASGSFLTNPKLKGNITISERQFLGKICEIVKIDDDHFTLMYQEWYFPEWYFSVCYPWMVKELPSIKHILDSE